jgi:hypothetical protein
MDGLNKFISVSQLRNRCRGAISSLKDDKCKTDCIITASACFSHICSDPAVRTHVTTRFDARTMSLNSLLD